MMQAAPIQAFRLGDSSLSGAKRKAGQVGQSGRVRSLVLYGDPAKLLPAIHRVAQLPVARQQPLVAEEDRNRRNVQAHQLQRGAEHAHGRARSQYDSGLELQAGLIAGQLPNLQDLPCYAKHAQADVSSGTEWEVDSPERGAPGGVQEALRLKAVRLFEKARMAMHEVGAEE